MPQSVRPTPRQAKPRSAAVHKKSARTNCRTIARVPGSLAEHERELIKERTALKRAASRANGTKFGRPRKVSDADHIATARRIKADGHTGRDIAKYLGVSRATLYRYLDEDHRA